MSIGVVVAAVAVMSIASQAGAETAAPTASTQAREGGRVVLVCDRSTKTRRTFEQEHGAPAVFMSAEQLAKAQATKEGWATPRCITSAELQRYEQLADEARVMRARGD